MHVMVQIGIVFSLCILGEAVVSILSIPIPGNIIGMILLLILLALKWIKIKHIQDISNFLLRNMAFFFIPAGVGIIENFEMMKGQLVSILLVCLLSTVITFAVTGLTAEAIIHYQEKRRTKDE